MREIKFRGRKSGYRSDKKEWVFGDYFYDGFHCVHCIREGGHIPPTYDEPGGDYHQEDHEINADTLGQYTGLKDKNGKEIYEGDVIKQGDDPNCRFSPRVVEFKDGSWIGNGIRIYLDQDKYDYRGVRSQYKWEIIGNVHENPELIKL